MPPNHRLEAAFDRHVQAQGTLRQWLAVARDHHLQLADWMAQQHQPGRMLVIGINGTQGSGKSTLAALLRHLLSDGLGLRTVVLSIDDFYLTRSEREQLARDVHPLLLTRGVPGTHDVPLAARTLEGLRAGGRLRLPRFIKVRDDRAPESEWSACEGPVDVVLFEGWCIGTPPQAPEELRLPANALESAEDADGRWRSWVNEQLASGYAALFRQLDHLVLLRAPGFEVVHGWRLEQEAGNTAATPGAHHVMTSEALKRFIAHYERLTRHALRVLPGTADVVISLDEARRIVSAQYRRQGAGRFPIPQPSR